MTPFYEIQKEEDEYYNDVRFLVYELGEYENSSVLAGQQFRRPIEEFLSIADAIKRYPSASVVDAYRFEPCEAPMFDPNPRLTAECGESWEWECE